MKKSAYINPFETQEVHYWARRWHIRPSELFTAMMETGSNHTAILRKAVMPEGSFHHLIRQTAIRIALKLL
jgi:hypothetical protein